jgi:hypothetical protein
MQGWSESHGGPSSFSAFARISLHFTMTPFLLVIVEYWQNNTLIRALRHLRLCQSVEQAYLPPVRGITAPQVV